VAGCVGRVVRQWHNQLGRTTARGLLWLRNGPLAAVWQPKPALHSLRLCLRLASHHEALAREAPVVECWGEEHSALRKATDRMPGGLAEAKESSRRSRGCGSWTQAR
jgi:hypothetical protein